MEPQERARKSADAMWASDNASKWFGFEILDVSEGKARLRLEVQEHHCNGHSICHGGVTFALADSAFAFACNSRNQNTVAQTNLITFVAPGHLGDVLIAEAEEVSLTGRSGVYDVTVKNQDQKIIAEFRGMSRTISGQLFEEDS